MSCQLVQSPFSVEQRKNNVSVHFGLQVHGGAAAPRVPRVAPELVEDRQRPLPLGRSLQGGHGCGVGDNGGKQQPSGGPGPFFTYV